MSYLDGMDVRARTWVWASYMFTAVRYKPGQWDISVSRRKRTADKQA